jgi:tRNA G18 (ribose-2'-O)-methylase SpoU
VRVVPVEDPGDPRLGDFRDLTDVAARSAREPAEGLFIAEGATVIERALAAGYVPRSVLTEPRWLPRLEVLLAGHDVEVRTADAALLRGVTGYRVHRGALASMGRRPLPDPAALLAGARLVLVLVDLVDHANVGAAFRNAAALGVDAVLVTPRCADPLYRRSVKVSMGAVLSQPWTRSSDDVPGDLAGLTTIALTPGAGARALDEVGLGLGARPRALLLGTEGDGLPEPLLARCDVRARIPMAGGVDSLNVAAASAIALYALRPGATPPT